MKEPQSLRPGAGALTRGLLVGFLAAGAVFSFSSSDAPIPIPFAAPSRSQHCAIATAALETQWRSQCALTYVPPLVSSSASPVSPAPRASTASPPPLQVPPSAASSPRRRAPGCPPASSGRLCALTDYFDEVVVLTIPRRARQLARLRRQLEALNASEATTEVVGFDKLSAVAQAAWAMYIRDRVVVDLGYDTLGELCVGLGWLAILEHVANSGAERTLVLEDDAVFHVDFPAEFDRRARLVPDNWLLFYLGATQHLWEQDGAQWPEDEVPEYYKIVNAWGAFAVGVSREAAAGMLAQHRKLDCRIDICTLPWVTKKNVGRCFAAYPHIVIADVRSSDLRGGSADASEFGKKCRWNLGMFDLDNGFVG